MSDPRPIVRPARPDDAPAIADAHVRGWQQAYRGLVPDAVLDRLDVERRAAAWHERLSAPPAPGETDRTWVVEAPDGVAGFVLAGAARDEGVPPPAGAGEVYAIYLRPERRGQGYGRALFGTAVEALVADGYDPLVVWVLEGNEAGRRFYTAAGFAADGASHTIDFDGEPVVEVRYRRSAPDHGSARTNVPVRPGPSNPPGTG
jgi:GNAT superfamily N-acetyltransferase